MSRGGEKFPVGLLSATYVSIIPGSVQLWGLAEKLHGIPRLPVAALYMGPSSTTSMITWEVL